MKKVIKKIFLLSILLMITLSNGAVMANIFDIDRGPNSVDRSGNKWVHYSIDGNSYGSIFKIYGHTKKTENTTVNLVDGNGDKILDVSNVPVIYFSKDDTNIKLLLGRLYYDTSLGKGYREKVWFSVKAVYASGGKAVFSAYSEGLSMINDTTSIGKEVSIGADRWCKLKVNARADNPGQAGDFIEFNVYPKTDNDYVGVIGFELWAIDKSNNYIPIAVFKNVRTLDDMKEIFDQGFDKPVNSATSAWLIDWFTYAFNGTSTPEERQVKVDSLTDEQLTAAENKLKNMDGSELEYLYYMDNTEQEAKTLRNNMVTYIEEILKARKEDKSAADVEADPGMADIIGDIQHNLGGRLDRLKNAAALVGAQSGPARPTVTHEDVVEHVDDWKPEDRVTGTGKTKLEEMGSKILSAVSGIGMVTAVLIIAVLGIKYMLGSVDEKAEYKKDMIPYLIGAVLLFGITAIVNVMSKMGNVISSIT